MVRGSRVARLFLAGLADQLEGKIQGLLRDPSPEEGRAIAKWLADNFYFQFSKTPKGGKDLKEILTCLHWYLAYGLEADSDRYLSSIESKWGVLKGQIATLIRLFTEEGGKKVPREVQAGPNTYLNLSGFSAEQVRLYVDALEAVWNELKGWRRKALAGGLKVALAGPREFNGTSAGKYKSSEDTLLVRATPQILKRTRGTYGALDYILVHELGHRYEYRVRPGVDFDRQEWQTTPYSSKEGERFAELFAISNFEIRGSWDPVVDKFEVLMASGKVAGNNGEWTHPAPREVIAMTEYPQWDVPSKLPP